MSTSPDPYFAYADGACLGNPGGRGGWGVVIIGPDHTMREFNGYEPETTNNRMELTAAIQALRRLPQDASVVLRSDSLYLVNTMTRGWKRNANRDLWRELDAEAEARRVDFEWVRGHAGDMLNERADALAAMGANQEIVSIEQVEQGKPATAQPASDGVEREAKAQAQIRSMLHAGEWLRKCSGCGRFFVARARDELFCNQTLCQLKARS